MPNGSKQSYITYSTKQINERCIKKSPVYQQGKCLVLAYRGATENAGLENAGTNKYGKPRFQLPTHVIMGS